LFFTNKQYRILCVKNQFRIAQNKNATPLSFEPFYKVALRVFKNLLIFSEFFPDYHSNHHTLKKPCKIRAEHTQHILFCLEHAVSVSLAIIQLSCSDHF